jgi:hypothetical protein
VLILVGASGFAYEEASVMMGVAVGTVKSRANRARARLAEMLGLEEGEELLSGVDGATLAVLGDRACAPHEGAPQSAELSEAVAQRSHAARPRRPRRRHAAARRRRPWRPAGPALAAASPFAPRLGFRLARSSRGAPAAGVIFVLQAGAWLNRARAARRRADGRDLQVSADTASSARRRAAAARRADRSAPPGRRGGL